MTTSYIYDRKVRLGMIVPPAPPPPPPPPPPPIEIPDATWTKSRILDWLGWRGVTIDTKAQRTLSKDELLDMVESVLSEEV